MFVYIFILILLLPLAIISSVVECLFSPDQLTEVGIQ